MPSDIMSLAGRFPQPRVLMGQRTRKFPISRDPTHFQITDKLVGCRSTYLRASNGTPHPAYPTAVLVDESPDREEADAIWLTRTYSTIPATRSEPTSMAIQFPGMASGATGEEFILRNPYTVAVLAREEYEYFLTSDPFGIIDPANAIVVLRAFKPNTVALPSVETDYVFDAGGTFALPSNPSLATYSGWIAAGTEIVAKDSEITQYAGDIWCRKTTYAKAR